MDVSCSFTIKTEVLGKRLENAKSISMISKIPKRVGILVEVATCKALISIIKPNKMSLILNNFQNLCPLILCWILSCWIMRTWV